MNRTRYTWFIVMTLTIILACSSTDPDTLPYRPVFGSSSPDNTTSLRVLPVTNVSSVILPLQIDAMRARGYPGSDIVIEATLDPGVNYGNYYVSYLSEGLKIYARMTVPNGEKPSTGWPVIIFNHGYIPPAVYRTTERYIAYVDQIASSGYIVFKSDYRGHDRSEGAAGGAYTEPNYSIDVLNAVASMKRHPDADPDRIGMWGHSMGGYITLRSMVVSQDIKVGVIWAGVVAPYPDLFTRWNPGARYAAPSSQSWVYLLQQTYGTVEQNPRFWNSISANAYVSDLNRPIQLHHATADHDVPWEFSQMLYDEMLEANQVAEFYTYEGDNHNISNSFNLAMQRTIEFFDRYLKTD
ncbi:MAG: alpha/beta hydrolase [Anaerolineae bacterium]|nr:alpha/beta hydrolase [Anaerolineae bacterium]MCI0610429.1 alpha/beta hydrolase [Anaerolineae bacterium]